MNYRFSSLAMGIHTKRQYSYLLLLVITLSSLLCCGQVLHRCTGSQHLVICVSNDAHRVCEQASKYNVTTNLMRINQVLRQFQWTCVTLRFAGGRHVLQQDLRFEWISRRDIAIIGANGSRQTTIECNRYYISFESSGVLIHNAAFKNCWAWMTFYFYNVYNLTLDNVTIQNSVRGIQAYGCSMITLRNCRIINSTSDNMKIDSGRDSTLSPNNMFLHIYKSWFSHSINGSGLEVIRVVEVDAKYTIHIIDSIFHNNNIHHVVIKEDYGGGADNLDVVIRGCNFTDSPFGIFILQLSYPDNHLKVTISNSTINRSYLTGLYVRNAYTVVISSCKMLNSGTGIHLYNEYSCAVSEFGIPTIISQTDFFNNSNNALDLDLTACNLQSEGTQEVLIRNCTFSKNTILNSVASFSDTLLSYNAPSDSFDNIIISVNNSQFVNNHIMVGDNNSTAINVDCSVLYAFNLSVIMSNVSFINNTCTGILLNSTTLKVQSLYFFQNSAKLGGAIRMLNSPSKKESMMTFHPHASLQSFQNRAAEYGGVIYSDKYCKKERKECFFQLDSSTLLPTLNFTGNRADKGGDIFFGGCLSGCTLKSGEVIDLNDVNNIFWSLVSLSPSDKSQSIFAEHPNRVTFCKNSSDPNRPTCKEKQEFTVYRGGSFTVELMVVGQLCYPSYNIIHATIPQGLGKGVEIRKGENYKEANPYCEKHTFTLQGGQGNASNFTIDIALDFQDKSATGNKLTHLIVNYINQCPSGFEIDENKDTCHCISVLQLNGVECILSNYSLEVPALTWVGMWQQQVAVGSSCQYCQANGIHIIENTSNSDSLCVKTRSATLCGRCIKGYSIKLGGYQCGDCSKYSYLGYILTIIFAIVGFLLVLTLLKLNITVSTGLINALIFYSNIVYSSHSVFLPLNTDTHSEHLNNAVHFLFIFKAWLNLDFGFDICYFHGTDMYTITWLQFVFPIYIWLLIIAIVIISRYSTRISKFTGHNTISVLATLLLLSHTKLLLAVLSALSYTRLHLEGGDVSYPLWSSDPNIRYAAGKHIGLFLMSFVMISAYIIPFTLLVSLGPLLISKSNHKALRWIHKVRPFLDAFYGPYTRTYYYWPGILLLLRIILVCIIAFYSTGDGSYITLSITISLMALLLLWQLMGKTHQVSLHRDKKLNLVELFFILNLMAFAVFSLYLGLKFPKDIQKQQILAVVMTGSVFAVFCYIVAHHIFLTVRPWRITNKIVGALRRKKSVRPDAQQEPLDGDSIGTYYNNKKPATQTELEVPRQIKAVACTHELREPLLEN